MQRFFALALLLAGCGDDGETIADAAPSDTPSHDAAIDGGPLAKEGQVFIAEAHAPIEISSAFAMFGNGPLLVPTATADGCISAANSSSPTLDAGSITIAGTTMNVALAQEQPGDVYTPTAQTPENLFVPGATLTATATGAVVPSFTASVTAPAALANLTVPASLSRTSSATITWTAATGTAMWFLVNSATATEGTMLCRTTDSGSFTLTPAALALLPPALTKVRITSYRLNETTTTAGAWTIYMRAADTLTSAAIDLGA